MRALGIFVLAIGCAAGQPATEPFDAGDMPDAGAVPDAVDAGAAIDAGNPDAGPVVHTGVLVGIAGLRYVSGNTGGTTDAQGSFKYEDGAPIAFYAGGLLLARVPGAALLTPFAMTGSWAATDALRKLLALLESLDADPADGI